MLNILPPTQKFELRPRPPLTTEELQYIRGRYPALAPVSFLAWVVFTLSAIFIEPLSQFLSFRINHLGLLQTALVIASIVSLTVTLFLSITAFCHLMKVIQDREAKIIRQALAILKYRNLGLSPRRRKSDEKVSANGGPNEAFDRTPR